MSKPMAQQQDLSLGREPVASLFRRYFVPTLMGMLASCLVTAVDGAFVGHGAGAEGIAAITLFMPLYMVLSAVGMMVGIGCSVVASFCLAGGQRRKARIHVSQAVLAVTVLAVVSMLLIIVLSRPLTVLLGSSDALRQQVIDYMVWSVVSLPFQMWVAVGLFVIRLDGAPRTAMWCNLTSAVLNIALDYVFIFPLQMGVKGAAIASSISFAVGGTIAIAYMSLTARTLRLLPPSRRMNLRIFAANIWRQSKIGSSTLLGEMTMAVLMFAGNHAFMRYLGGDGVGAFGVACYYLPFVFMTAAAIAQSAQPILSFNFGAGYSQRVAETRRIVVRTGLVAALLVMLAFVLLPRYLVAFFISTDTVAARLAIEGFPWIATGFLAYVFNLVMIGYHQSLEHNRPAVAYALLRGLVLLVPAYLLLPTVIGVPGLWLAMPAAETLTAAVVTRAFVKVEQLEK